MTILHAVTRDLPDIPDDNFVLMIEAILPYVDFVQLREKSRSSRALGLLIERIVEKGLPLEKFIINDRADIAHAYGIPRTHLTEKSLNLSRLQDAFPAMKFGRSFHSLRAIERELPAYDYGYLGHIFRTSEKSYPALGIDVLKEAGEIATQNGGKLIAIGGINSESLAEVLPFVAGTAVMSALFPVTNHQFDIELGRSRAKLLREKMDEYCGKISR